MLVITEVCLAGDGTDEMVFLCLLDQMEDQDCVKLFFLLCEVHRIFKIVFSHTDGRLEGTHWIEMSLKMVELRAHVVF